MYSLVLTDGTTIANLRQIKPYVFELDSDNVNNEIYFALNDNNLALAMLYEDDELIEILMDYTRQNFYYNNHVVEFRLAPIAKIEAMLKHRDQKEKKKRRDLYLKYRIEDEMEARGE